MSEIIFIEDDTLGGSGIRKLKASDLNPGTQAQEATQQQVRDLLPAAAGTREHDTDTITRQPLGAASARVALPPLGASREVYVMPNVRAFFRTGTSGVTAAAGTSHPLAIDERFYFKVPDGHTHIAFVRETADGNITICAVA